MLLNVQSVRFGQVFAKILFVAKFSVADLTFDDGGPDSRPSNDVSVSAQFVLLEVPVVHEAEVALLASECFDLQVNTIDMTLQISIPAELFVALVAFELARIFENILKPIILFSF